MYGLKEDWEGESQPKSFVLDDYKGTTARWCSGCGDHALLSSLQRLARDEQLPPEKTVFVSGIGCSSRLPHYMKTYGFHGLHGRPLPIASGVRARRPDLNVFVVTGDGDCCAIGTAHWIHAIRYNMKMTVMLVDNNIYGLTKMQSSPTTPKGASSLTHPGGVPLKPLNPITVTLGITNASFVAQTVDWNPPHLFATLQAAHRHPGLAFVRIIQRCPHYMPTAWEGVQRDPQRILLMTHPDGIPLDAAVSRPFTNRVEHDPRDIDEARHIAARDDVLPMGLFYTDPAADRYDRETVRGVQMSVEEKLEGLEHELDRFVI